MKFRFIHAADIHLGYEQYNLTARANDFARAYVAMVEYARESRADFVLIAGDLFHRSSADAWMLKQATHGLALLHEAGIPVIAVEGNHDAQHARKQLSWMEFLCDQELLTLLNIVTAPNGYKSVEQFDPTDRRGTWIDVAGARVYGMKYYGAATARFLEEIGGQVEAGPNGYTIMMLHAGMQGQVPHLHGGLTPAQIEVVRPAVDYLALGHVHRRLQEEWVFNPGSTEINSTEELDWPHGFFDVHVDTDASPKQRVEAIDTPGLRPFHRIRVHTEGEDSMDSYTTLVQETIASESGVSEGSVLEIDLEGIAGFRRQDVPVEMLRGEAEARFNPLVVRIRNNLVPPSVVAVRHGERMKRPDLERTVIEQMVYQHADYRDRAAAWTSLILDVKTMAAARETSAASIADHVRHTLAGMEHGVDEAAELSVDESQDDKAQPAPPRGYPAPAPLVQDR